MNNQRKSLAHFTSLSKKPHIKSLNNKYVSSIPSPNDSFRKLISNINTSNTNEEIIMITKNILNKSKDTECKS